MRPNRLKRMDSRFSIDFVQVRDAEECARLCDFFRDRRQYQCHAFAYREDFGRTEGTCVLSDSYGRDMDADLEYGRDWEVFEYQGEGRHCRSGGSTGENCLFIESREVFFFTI